jgi:hypothetical protein
MEHLIELMEDHSTDHYVMARDCHVNRTTNDLVRWKNETDTDYTIHFDKTPFRENDFVVCAHREKGPMELAPKVVPKIYAYEIQPPKAKASTIMAADPNVIVH